MTISHWPHQDKPREKLLTQGASTLSDSELVAILLRTGSKGQSAIDLARRLLTRHGSLRELFNQPFTSLSAEKGIGNSKVAQLLAAKELGKRLLAENFHQQPCLHNRQATYDYLLYELRDQTEEIFACIFLTARNQVIAFEPIFRGSLTHTPVHPRVLLKRCLYHNAAAIILVHNHPSGDPTPSAADRHLTQQLTTILQPLEISLHDHLVIGNNQVISLNQTELLLDKVSDIKCGSLESEPSSWRK